MTQRSADFVDGLQVAYQIVYQLHGRERHLAVCQAYTLAMKKINEAIEQACAKKDKMIIVP